MKWNRHSLCPFVKKNEKEKKQHPTSISIAIHARYTPPAPRYLWPASALAIVTLPRPRPQFPRQDTGPTSCSCPLDDVDLPSAAGPGRGEAPREEDRRRRGGSWGLGGVTRSDAPSPPPRTGGAGMDGGEWGRGGEGRRRAWDVGGEDRRWLSRASRGRRCFFVHIR
jgi:hypothetical protein